MESDWKIFTYDAIRFNDFINKKVDASYLSETFQSFLIMDILKIPREEIEIMGVVEYREALHYAETTYQTRNMATTEGQKPGSKSISFEQPKDYDIDPNFYSQVKSKK